MAQNFKRLAAGLLAVILCASLATGCGSKEPNTSSDVSGNSSTDSGASAPDISTPESSSADVSGNEQGSSSATSSGKDQSTPGNQGKTTQGKGNPTTNTTNKTSSSSFDISTAPMPSRTPDGKTLTYFSWATLEQSYGKDAKSLPNLFKKEFGITLKGQFSTHDTYWEDLSRMKAANNSPDLVDLPNWNFYPLPITENLLQPLDELIDFSDPLWADTASIRNSNKWKGKTYVPFMSETLQTWFIYNTKMFKDYGLNKQTPRTYYEKNDWTWARMQELADKFVKKNASKEIVQWGLTMQTGDLIATTGLELVSGNGKGGYVYNLKDAKVAKMMNLMYDMGTAGSGSLYTGDAITGFKSGKVAMIITNASTLTVDFNDMRKDGRIDWVPMPKMDASSNYYNQSSFDPGWGIPVGAKNPKSAALFIEYVKWFGLGYNFCPQIPAEKKNAAAVKYNLKDTSNADTTLTADELAKTKAMIDKNYKRVSIIWQSWLGTQVLPGYGTVTSGAKKWSAALEEEFPATDALLQSYVA